MKKVLLDINIILDLLNKRDDHESAAKLFDLCALKEIKGYLCSHEITTLSYFMEKFKYPSDKRILIINNLLDVFSIIPATEKILRDSLLSNITDFEDAVIEVSARNLDIDYIVSRNHKDFKDGIIPCCNAKEALSLIKS